MFTRSRSSNLVAPLAGSVDRNYGWVFTRSEDRWVAPLAGSVDRNGVQVLPITDDQLSLPSRGARIEIGETPGYACVL